MDVRQQIERELDQWVAARKELTLATRLAEEDPQSSIHQARVRRAEAVVRETVSMLKAAMEARGISREKLQEVLRAS